MAKSSDILLGLTGTMWPIHLKPQDDELLSSWLIRLAHGHGYKIEEYCTLLFGRGSSIWNRDIDVLAPEYVKNTLKQITGVTDDQFERTTLRSFEGELCESLNVYGLKRWILSLGIHHRKRNRHGLMYCPHCLRSDLKPYFRRRWRLAFSTVCTLHKCWLLDACPVCNESVVPHRVDMTSRCLLPNKDLIGKCWHCSAGLNHSERSDKIEGGLVEFQAVLEKALSNGWIAWAGNDSMYSQVFFDGLHALISGLTSKETKRRINRSNQMECFHIDQWNERILENSSINYRRDLFLSLSILLDKWPERFVELIHQQALRYSDLRTDSDRLVYWYEKLIKDESWVGNPVFHDSEKESVIQYIEQKRGYFTHKAARHITGRDVSKYVKTRSSSHVNDEVYEDLLISLDHEIAATRDINTKACLIRDKIMFACCRIFHLSALQLSLLTIDDVQNICHETAKLDFYHNAKNKGAVRAWLDWYVLNLRPKLQPRNDCEYIFTSTHTRRGLKKSTISLRFIRAVNAAELKRYVKSYYAWTH